MVAPFKARWTEQQMLDVLPFWRPRLERELKPGDVVDLVEHNARSSSSHKHFFAAINEAWKNLREGRDEEFPDPEILRKWCLTYTSYCDVRHYQTGSFAESTRLARILKEQPEYCRVKIDGRMVTQFTPHSQSYEKMSGRTFQACKGAVFDVLARELGVTVEALEEAGKKAAA
jgi:hypothetical protein